jgi:hypothetical protein
MEEVTKMPVDRPYIKLMKMKGYNNWEIKIYSDTSKEDMDRIRAILDEQNKEMQKSYDFGLVINSEKD